MTSVIWHPDAEYDLTEIVDYISLDNAPAAVELALRIAGTVEDNLSETPNMGRPGRVKGTRELVVHKNYIVVYCIEKVTIQVLAIVHAKASFCQQAETHRTGDRVV